MFKYKNFFIFLIFFALFPVFAIASEIRLEGNKIELKRGEQLIVNVILYTKEQINAIDGQIIFTPNALEAKEIRDGNSPINFWIEKPHVESAGVITFSGITPGGFGGVEEILFSIVFEAKNDGVSSIMFKNARALLNDGAGTEEFLKFFNAKVIVKAESGEKNKEILRDIIPPESFVPTVTRNPFLFDNKWFVVFATQDKNSGISRYEIKEYKFKILSYFKKWKVAESPYVVSDQSLKNYIDVRAVDNYGNKRVVKVAPNSPVFWYESVFNWIIILIVGYIGFCIYFKLWKKRLK